MEIATFMPKNLYYEDVKIIKRPFKAKFRRFLFLFSMVFVVVGVVFASIFLSKALTVGNITTAIVYGGKDVKIAKQQIYLVTLGKYDNYDDAEKVALGSTIQGASGFIWLIDKDYYVVGNAYRNGDDANVVKKNLQSSNYDIEVIEMTFPKININFDDFESKEVSKIKKAFEFIDDIYDNLYNYSIKFDKGEINNFAVCSNISSIRGECKVQISGIQGLLLNKNSDNLQKLINCLTKLDEILNVAILKTIDNSSTNYSLKNSIVSIMYEKYNLYKSL